MYQITLSNIIIEEIEKSANFQQVLQKFPWTALSPNDKSDLFRRVDAWGDDPKVKILLMYIVNASAKIDIPSHTRALILAFSNSQFKEIKDNIETNCLKSLGELRDQTKDSGVDGVRRYQFYLADFHSVKAQNLFDDGKFQEAKLHYQEALKIYNQIGGQDDTLADKKRIVQKYIEQIESQISENMQIGSADSLRNERLELLEEVRNQTGLLEQLTKEYKSLQTKTEEGGRAISQIKSDFTVANKKLKSIQEKIKENESAAQFLVALPQLTMSPLWVEVVRLALDKGEMDEFTKKCLEVLRVSYPKDTVPLLMEIAVRAPTSIPISIEAAQFGLEKFSALMKEAHSLETTDELHAAKKMVEAWDVFYSISRSIGETR